LGADQLVEVEGEVLAKPADRDAARRQLGKLLGHTHDICTGVCLVGPGGHISEALEVSRLTCRSFGCRGSVLTLNQGPIRILRT
jgi:septum formation protein